MMFSTARHILKMRVKKSLFTTCRGFVILTSNWTITKIHTTAMSATELSRSLSTITLAGCVHFLKSAKNAFLKDSMSLLNSN